MSRTAVFDAALHTRLDYVAPNSELQQVLIDILVAQEAKKKEVIICLVTSY